MNLVVFDIDDTLTRTMDVDTQCFVQTGSDLLRMELDDVSWDDFPDVTDTAVLNVIYERRRGRLPTDTEVGRFIDYFLTLLREHHEVDASRFRQVEGAQTLLAALGTRNDWTVALATGAWKRTAEFKLNVAGIFDELLPLATSDDHHTRAGIFNTAVQRAKRASGTSGYHRIVAVGDGPWDVRTAQELGVPFIGVGSDARLREIGAPAGVPDYRDLERFMDLLETAEPP
ncbi:MAG: HAD family hydrolase [Longimicrobiales bacterium]